ncbi:insulinase family protein [Puteibacter caeruleilacunae]|nr:insulinase family protein [Puteibacter caeruleilacunae]
MQYFTHTLSNHIRVVHVEVDSPVAHLGILVNTGSRDELEEEQGMAHFIEHTIFKGTKKRRAYHILSRLEDVGGELNAYTTKEETALYATFLNGDYNRAIELMSDIMNNSVFPKKELEKEKEVVIEEINSYKDSPSELIFDEFEELLYAGHPLGRNILGTPQNVRKFTRKKVLKFIQRNYHTDQMVICSIGKIKFDRFTKLIDKHFEGVPARLRGYERERFEAYQPIVKELSKDTYQAHCMLGNIAYNNQHPKRVALVLLNNILGGTSMNSRLNMVLREKHGMAYNIESNYTAYSDTGQFNIYFGTEKENLDRARKIVMKELDRLKNVKLGSLQLSKAKKQLIGQLAVSQENREDLLLTIGKSYMLYNRIDSLEEISAKVNALTALDLMDVANEVFDSSKLSMLTVY